MFGCMQLTFVLKSETELKQHKDLFYILCEYKITCCMAPCKFHNKHLWLYYRKIINLHRELIKATYITLLCPHMEEIF